MSYEVIGTLGAIITPRVTERIITEDEGVRAASVIFTEMRGLKVSSDVDKDPGILEVSKKDKSIFARAFLILNQLSNSEVVLNYAASKADLKKGGEWVEQFGIELGETRQKIVEGMGQALVGKDTPLTDDEMLTMETPTLIGMMIGQAMRMDDVTFAEYYSESSIRTEKIKNRGLAELGRRYNEYKHKTDNLGHITVFPDLLPIMVHAHTQGILFNFENRQGAEILKPVRSAYARMKDLR